MTPAEFNIYMMTFKKAPYDPPQPFSWHDWHGRNFFTRASRETSYPPWQNNIEDCGEFSIESLEALKLSLLKP